MIRKLCVVSLIMFAAACGSSGPTTSPSQPSTPTPTPTPAPVVPAVPTGVATTVALETATVTVTWNAVPAANRYVVELGQTSGGVSATHQTAVTTDSFPGLATGKYYLRVKSANDVGSSAASVEATAVVIDRSISDFVDGLLIGHGPFHRGNVADCPAELPEKAWTAFARGTTVRVRISRVVPSAAVNAITALASQAVGATGGNLNATVELTDEIDPQADAGQMTITQVPDPAAKGCGPGTGCVVYKWAPVTTTFGLVLAASAYVRNGEPVHTFVHEIGHGLYGLCHVDGNRIGGGNNSLMSINSAQASDVLTPRDISALQAVYSTSLNPNANRSAFIRVGLVTQ